MVHATSNIQLNAWRLQESFKPGASVGMFVSLKEYDIPLPPVRQRRGRDRAS
jgi:hypothetical protein